MLSLLEPDLTCPIKHEMPELSPAAAAVGEKAGGDSPSRDGIHQQSSIGSLGSAAYQTLPQHNREYLQASYWDERFKHEGAYEWYADYRELREHLRGHLAPGDRVLVLGCGNSSLAEDLYCDSLGVSHIVSVDISPTVIQHMGAQAAHRGHHELKWQVADMLQLPFANASFDVVLDKGTLDVLVVDADSLWDPQPSTKERMFQAIDEVHRILTPSGRLVSITFAQPHFRKPFLTAAKYDWHLNLTTVDEGCSFPFMIYALTRGQRLPDEQAVAFGGTLNTPDAALGSHVHEQMDNEDYLLSMDL